MFVLPLILAAGGLFTLSIGAPLPNTERDTSIHYNQKRATTTYEVYSGDGDANVGWPALSEWIDSFDTMFDNQNDVLKASCTQFDVANNSDDEIADLKSAISEVASTTGIDSRFILAIVIQESNGCVRAPTTVYSISNPGLMQSHEGAGTCNSGTSVQNPCPKSEMVQMITDGTAGTSSGDGLKQCIAESGATDVSMYYKAARIYNSGSIASGGNLGDGVATHCYATDVANRLTGWYSGISTCNSAIVGTLTGSSGSSGSSAVSSVVASASSVISSVVSSAVSVATSAYSVPSISIPNVSIPSVSISLGIVPSVSVSISLGIVPSVNGYAVSSATATSIDVQPFFTGVLSASSTSAYESGAAFAQVTASPSSSVATPSSITSAISVPTTASLSTTILASISSIASSIPLASLPSTLTTGTAPLPTTSSTSSSNTTSTSTSTTYTPGTSCDSLGEWNCIDGNSFQQCASGTWSTVGGLAAGTACTVGTGSTIDIFATSTGSGSKHRRHAGARHLAHGHMHGLRRSVKFLES